MAYSLPELVLFDAKGDGGVYVKAILLDGSKTAPIGVCFASNWNGSRQDGSDGENLGAVANRGGSTGFSFYRYGENNASAPTGVGIDLSAWGLTDQKVIGFEIYFYANSFCSGPDLIGLALRGYYPSEVPEAGTAAALAAFLTGGGLMVLRNRRRQPSA